MDARSVAICLLLFFLIMLFLGHKEMNETHPKKEFTLHFPWTLCFVLIEISHNECSLGKKAQLLCS